MPALRLESPQVPPLLAVAVAFAVSGICGEAARVARGRTSAPSASEVAVGGATLAGAFFFYFVALARAEPVAANLIAYSWPFLMVVVGAVLLRESVGGRALFGVALGGCGIALAVLRDGASEQGWSVAGCAAAFASALCWTTYSVFFRRRSADSFSVARFLLVGAVAAGVAHGFLEAPVWPETFGGWAAFVALAIGPLGGAFYCWDWAVKRGDLAFLGSLACAVPVLAAILLVALGRAEADGLLAAAALAVGIGAFLARGDSRVG